EIELAHVFVGAEVVGLHVQGLGVVGHRLGLVAQLAVGVAEQVERVGILALFLDRFLQQRNRLGVFLVVDQILGLLVEVGLRRFRRRAGAGGIGHARNGEEAQHHDGGGP